MTTQNSQPVHDVIVERDVRVTMRDGTILAVDVYRPATPGHYPALLSMSPYSKDVQRSNLPRRPLSPPIGNGGQEAGDTEFFVARGYVHVIADARGSGKSEGEFDLMGPLEQSDGYDLIEWMATEPWCDGNVGMLGMSYFGVLQLLVGALRPPHLKALVPYEAYTDLYRHSAYHGGVLSLGHYYQWWGHVSVGTRQPSSLSELDPDFVERRRAEIMAAAVEEGFPFLYVNVQHPEKNPRLFDALMHPFDDEYYQNRSSATRLGDIEVPCLFVSRWSGGAIHLPGAFAGYSGVSTPKKMLIMETEYPTGPLRPWADHKDLVLRWYDHWLKGIDTGIMDEPPITLLVRGAGYRTEQEWPLARTEWTEVFLGEGQTLSTVAPTTEGSVSFESDPLLGIGLAGPGIRFQSAPTSEGIEVTGPVTLHLTAVLDQPDTTWMVTLLDISPSGVPSVVTRGWLRASHRETALDPIQPYKVYHPHTSSVPVTPGEPVEYAIDLGETSQFFRPGHRIGLEIKAQDGDTVHFWHYCQPTATRHDITFGGATLSRLSLPVISGEIG